MTDLLFAIFLMLASFDNRLVRPFCSLGMYSMIHSSYSPMSSFTLAKYCCSYGSLAWNSPWTWPITSWESPLITRLRIPNSFASPKLANSASYLDYLLLALNMNLRNCSMDTPLWSSRIILVPLPLLLDNPSTYNFHVHFSSSLVMGGDSSPMKSVSTWAFIGSPRSIF